ncbi:LysR family transcriptional regulator [Oharaeibacter diazotrophicus]|uniref:DNA-binding transcriptional LysR family regulator n=1 Tax=Oharaeibacter diazotrophicus TaxID=1920512 RepID=A0A4R6RN25_9HYPH|nr:LysR family transcriptional regulator [Oharaeibacter diazotrophicus]TDP87206.1 DNA-binding transcriptional LysR family regulator [Oharaeibacter diazotrophicus]BBE70851.1 HTH-type transcriptional regulator BenM [Pleomorphomonas sp. SM30]GLS77600.1 LysR family transcriptional regulator [Oharaeibacter diazotrophicus]
MRRLSGIDLRLLKIFATVVECNGFQNAQIALNISQSTLSTHIANLEAKLGSRLCERGRAGFKLTRAGEETYEGAQDLFRSIESFEARMGRVHGTESRRFRIGVIDTVVTSREVGLDRAVAAFGAAYPDVFVDLEISPPQLLERSLAEGRRDIVIGPLSQSVPAFEYREVTVERHALYCGRDHPWFGRPDAGITRADLMATQFSVRAYRYFDDVYRFGKAKANASVSNMEAQEIMVLSGRYVGFLPDHAAARWVEAGLMRAVRPADWGLTSRFLIAFDPAGELRPLKRAFQRLVCTPAPAAADA